MKKVTVSIEKCISRLRIRINGQIHISMPYDEKGPNIIVHAYLIGSENYYNIDYTLSDGRVIESGYTRKDIFDNILLQLEKLNII